jgi:dTDP-4-dehydrorhamnose reductase
MPQRFRKIYTQSMPQQLKIAVTGAAGLFGAGLVRVLNQHHHAVGLTRARADITDSAAVAAVIGAVKPDVIIHSAAIASPDVCETQPALATAVNVEGTRNMVRAAEQQGAHVALISTDCVFDGQGNTPYVETDPVNPLSFYGRTKVLAEEIVRQLPGHFIFRVSVLFGRDKPDFVSKGLRALCRGEPYVVASDQYGSATYIDDAANTIRQVIEAQAFGTFHLSNEGACTREELARRAARLAGLDDRGIVAKPLASMNRPGPRMLFAVMEHRALRQRGFARPRPWPEALAEYVPLIQSSIPE